MPRPEHNSAPPDPRNPGESLPIVVGAHLLAEVEDRPIADSLCRALTAAAGPDYPLAPVVVTDLWYLNHERLRAQPSVSIGRPEVNAFSAYLADKLTSVLAVEGRMIVQLDPEMLDPVACCWGIDDRTTAEAAHAFLARWSTRFLHAASRRSSPTA